MKMIITIENFEARTKEDPKTVEIEVENFKRYVLHEGFLIVHLDDKQVLGIRSQLVHTFQVLEDEWKS